MDQLPKRKPIFGRSDHIENVFQARRAHTPVA